MASTLAESLLDDLDDLSDLEEGVEEEEFQRKDDDEDEVMKDASSMGDNVTDGNNNGMEDASPIKHAIGITKRKRLLDDIKLNSHLEAIRPSLLGGDKKQKPAYENDDDKQQYEESQYDLMTSCNKFLISVQNELSKVYSDLVQAYQPKFPELEDLLPDAISYKNAIKVIQNEQDITMVNEKLSTEAHLTPNQIITLSVASSTTAGQPLDPSQLRYVNECITYMEQILDVQSQLIRFVEGHMEKLAPNTCVLIGPTLAARIVATAGGMAELSRIPACNLQVLGQVKATAASRGGMSTSIAGATASVAAQSQSMGHMQSQSRLSKPHEGMLSESELYRRVPPQLQRKALKVIAAKLALAIRCDFVNLESGRERTKTSGLKFRSEIERKFAKLEEPDMAPVVKALPK